MTFALPKAVDSSESSHVKLLSPERLAEAAGPAGGGARPPAPDRPGAPGQSDPSTASPVPEIAEGFEHVRFLGVPSSIVHPYQRRAGEGPVGTAGVIGPAGTETETGRGTGTGAAAGTAGTAGIAASWLAGAGGAGAGIPSGDYGGDLINQVLRYAAFCAEAARHLDFDLIHAHDWLTYPAGLQVARITGRPLVVHVHSTEFDRSGEAVNQTVYDVERRGMHGALRVITVSQLTRNMVVRRYGVPADRVEVVYNGVEIEPRQVGMTGIQHRDKIVLYFGRITYQKGPEYFVAAAKRVLEVMDDVKFVVAGSGDMARRMIELAAEWGIGHKILFTGFLRGDDIPRVFSLADLYVMPSVSEPFGIAPLEAMSHDVPVLISRSSGVSEVLSHALKVDFWDIDDMANKIVAVLRHPPLSQTLRDHGAFEVRKLTWDGAAQRCGQIYDAVVHGMSHRQKAGC